MRIVVMDAYGNSRMITSGNSDIIFRWLREVVLELYTPTLSSDFKNEFRIEILPMARMQEDGTYAPDWIPEERYMGRISGKKLEFIARCFEIVTQTEDEYLPRFVFPKKVNEENDKIEG